MSDNTKIFHALNNSITGALMGVSVTAENMRASVCALLSIGETMARGFGYKPGEALATQLLAALGEEKAVEMIREQARRVRASTPQTGPSN